MARIDIAVATTSKVVAIAQTSSWLDLLSDVTLTYQKV